MVPLIFYNGVLLLKNGELALSTDCCCDQCVTCIDYWSVGWDNSATEPFDDPCEQTIIRSARKKCFSDGTDCTNLENSEWDPSWDPEGGAEENCIGLCKSNPLISTQASMYTYDPDTSTTIDSGGFPSFTATIDTTQLLSDYPEDECWIFFSRKYTADAEKSIYQCSYSPQVLDSRSYRSKLELYAVRTCCCDAGDATIENLTNATYITNITLNTAGSEELGFADYWVLANEDEEGLAIIPPIIPAVPSVACSGQCPT